MATAYQRDNGHWRVVVELERGPNGRRRRYFDAPTEEAAWKKMYAAYPAPMMTGVESKPERSGVTHQPDKSVTVVSELGKPLTLGDVDGLLRHHGLNPDDWQITNAVVNKWQTPAIDKKSGSWTQVWNYQLKVSMKPKLHLVLPTAARLDGPRYDPLPFHFDTEGSRLYAILPDQQIPFHDPVLHELVCDWLTTNVPEGLIISGDFYDFPSVSRHPKKAHELRMGGIQECLDVGYQVARDYVIAAGETCTERYIVPGNHEYRLQRAILDSIPEFYNLHRPEESTRLFSLEHLSRLDELGFKWAADPVYEEHYPQGHVTLSDKLAIYHGWVVRPDSGASALKTLETLGHSVIVGHTHRQSDVSHTFHEIDGKLRILRAAEAGTLAKVKGGLGYSMAPNWQPGFATVRLFPDGMFNIELAKYVNGVLMWGDQRYFKKSLRAAA